MYYFMESFATIMAKRMDQTGIDWQCLSDITRIEISRLKELVRKDSAEPTLRELFGISRALSFTFGDTERLMDDDSCHYTSGVGPKTLLDDIVDQIVKSDGTLRHEWVAKLFNKLDAYYRLRK